MKFRPSGCGALLMMVLGNSHFASIHCDGLKTTKLRKKGVVEKIEIDDTCCGWKKSCKCREREGGVAFHTTRKRTKIYVHKNEKGKTRGVSFFDYHIYHHPLRPVNTDSANVKIINRQGRCCLWVILMHLSSMLGQFFVFSGILQANRKLRYLLPHKT